ncbi:MAG: B12-binding domain-containing radical SAM protein [Candidatus Helarchaeota archaeon]
MIALVNVLNKTPFSNSRQPPLGMGYICSFLRSNKAECDLFDLAVFPISINKAVDLILQTKPELVGFTCYETNYFIIREFCKQIKRQDPNIKTVIGGPTSTFAYEDILNDESHVDFCVLGEGEQTLLELWQNINGNIDDLLEIKGLAFRHGDTPIKTAERPLIKDLDSIPSPYLSEIYDMKYYDSAYITNGRGCPKQCIFCTGSALFGHTVRFHSPERILEEIDYLYNLNIKNFLFSDDTVTISRKQINSILDGLEKRGHDISWHAQTRIDQISKEMLERMKKVGLKFLSFGLESADPFILKTIKKVRTHGEGVQLEEKHLQKFEVVFQWLKDLKILGMVGVILGNPYESTKHLEKTINYLKKIERKYGIKHAINVLVPLTGTEVFKKHREFQMVIKKDANFLLPYKIKKFSATSIEEIIEFRKKLLTDYSLFVWNEPWDKSLSVFEKITEKSRFQLSRETYYDFLRRDFEK